MTDPVVADSDVFITRSFAAPRAIVWKFWTQNELIAQWFGPDTFSVPVDTVDIDLRVGGPWNLTMVGGDGTRAPLNGTIVELVEEELLVVRLSAETGVGDLDGILLRVQFHDHGDTTRITLHQGPFTAEQRDLTASGWEQSFTHLDALCAGAVS